MEPLGKSPKGSESEKSTQTTWVNVFSPYLARAFSHVLLDGHPTSRLRFFPQLSSNETRALWLPVSATHGALISNPSITYHYSREPDPSSAARWDLINSVIVSGPARKGQPTTSGINLFHQNEPAHDHVTECPGAALNPWLHFPIWKRLTLFSALPCVDATATMTEGSPGGIKGRAAGRGRGTRGEEGAEVPWALRPADEGRPWDRKMSLSPARALRGEDASLQLLPANPRALCPVRWHTGPALVSLGTVRVPHLLDLPLVPGEGPGCRRVILGPCLFHCDNSSNKRSSEVASRCEATWPPSVLRVKGHLTASAYQTSLLSRGWRVLEEAKPGRNAAGRRSL